MHWQMAPHAAHGRSSFFEPVELSVEHQNAARTVTSLLNPKECYDREWTQGEGQNRLVSNKMPSPGVQMNQKLQRFVH